MTTRTFPKQDWQTIRPDDVGFNPQRLERAKEWLDRRMRDRPYRFVIVRGGGLVVEWRQKIDRDKRLPLASAAKSVYSNLLGVVCSERRIPSPDARARDYYPEMMDVPEGGGPKPGRHAFEKDGDITFRQLISNTSGYMKPGEAPGKVFHYQTYGMNILTHALAKLYGYYDVNDPEGSPGFKRLIEEKLARRIGAKWDYSLMNFAAHEKARLGVFGYYCQIHSNALDLARVGWLWCNWGRWADEQVVPESWMRESVKTNPDVIANCSEEDRRYGYGFWTNDHGRLWPSLPRDGFTASGAGGHYCSVFPRLDLVIVQSPGPYVRDPIGAAARGNPELLRLALDALDTE